jgi:hypothetical protein
MKLEVRKMLVILLFLFTSVSIFAQEKRNPPSPDMVVMNDGPPVPPGLPIDFGLSALLAAGLGLGIYHFKDKK